MDKTTSCLEQVRALNRVVARLKRRALVAKRRCEREQTDSSAERYLSAAEEFYYASRVAADFVERLAFELEFSRPDTSKN
jgi:hypothetical protein